MNFDLRTHDPDRYLLSLFISPIQGRSAFATLDQLNFELAHLRETVSTSPLGYIRLQWWRDELSSLCEGQNSERHPVLVGLQDIPKGQLRYESFDRILDARAMEFDEMAFSKIEDVWDYLDGAQGQLLIIKNSVIGSDARDESLLSLSRYYGIAGLVRSLPYYAKSGRRILPNLFPEDIIPHGEKMVSAVKALCDGGRTLRPNGRLPHRYWRATRALADLYYGAIEKAGYDPFHIQPVPFKELKVWLKSF